MISAILSVIQIRFRLDRWRGDWRGDSVSVEFSPLIGESQAEGKPSVTSLRELIRIVVLIISEVTLNRKERES